MLHAMLSDSKAGHQGVLTRATYLDTGVADLIQRVIDLGGNSGVLQFKIFGGAQTIQASDYFSVGTKNVRMMENLVAQLRLQVKTWEVGGCQNRTIRLYLNDGRVKLRTPGQPETFL
jgi:chemotaxis protein CheD